MLVAVGPHIPNVLLPTSPCLCISQLLFGRGRTLDVAQSLLEIPKVVLHFSPGHVGCLAVTGTRVFLCCLLSGTAHLYVWRQASAWPV